MHVGNCYNNPFSSSCVCVWESVCGKTTKINRQNFSFLGSVFREWVCDCVYECKRKNRHHYRDRVSSYSIYTLAFHIYKAFVAKPHDELQLKCSSVHHIRGWEIVHNFLLLLFKTHTHTHIQPENNHINSKGKKRNDNNILQALTHIFCVCACACVHFQFYS